MLIKDTTPDDVDKLIWKWIKGEAVTTPEFGDPLATDDYAFCVFDPSGIVMSAAIPAGGTCGTKPCWKALNGKGNSVALRWSAQMIAAPCGWRSLPIGTKPCICPENPIARISGYDA